MTYRRDPSAVYYYNLPSGDPSYRKLRFETGRPKPDNKYFSFEIWAGRQWVGGRGCMREVTRRLYRNEQLPYFHRVFVVEGEKCADLLWGLGILAVCNDDGAGKWRSDYSMALAGKDVVILPDADEPGRKHAEALALSLFAKVRSIKIVELPGLGPKEDVYDWLSAHGEML